MLASQWRFDFRRSSNLAPCKEPWSCLVVMFPERSSVRSVFLQDLDTSENACAAAPKLLPPPALSISCHWNLPPDESMFCSAKVSRWVARGPYPNSGGELLPARPVPAALAPDPSISKRPPQSTVLVHLAKATLETPVAGWTRSTTSLSPDAAPLFEAPGIQGRVLTAFARYACLRPRCAS